MTLKSQKRLLFAIRLSIGLSMLGFLLLWEKNWQAILDIFASARLSWLVPFILVSLLITWISCVKWQVFLRFSEQKTSQLRLFVLYLIGRFFNNFLPSSVGGDLVRSYMLGRHINSQGKAAASIFWERLTGFVAMVTLATGALAFDPILRSEPLVVGSIVVMGLGCMTVILMIWRPILVEKLVAVFRLAPFLSRFEGKTLRFHSHLGEFRGQSRSLVWSMALSYAFYIGAAANVYLGAKLLAVECEFLQLLVVTPIIMLLASLPLTPNGIGVWEWAFSVFLVSAGATPQEGLAIALAVRSKELALSLVGGVFFALEPASTKSLQMIDERSTAREEMLVEAASPTS